MVGGGGEGSCGAGGGWRGGWGGGGRVCRGCAWRKRDGPCSTGSGPGGRGGGEGVSVSNASLPSAHFPLSRARVAWHGRGATAVGAGKEENNNSTGSGRRAAPVSPAAAVATNDGPRLAAAHTLDERTEPRRYRWQDPGARRRAGGCRGERGAVRPPSQRCRAAAAARRPNGTAPGWHAAAGTLAAAAGRLATSRRRSLLTHRRRLRLTGLAAFIGWQRRGGATGLPAGASRRLGREGPPAGRGDRRGAERRTAPELFLMETAQRGPQRVHRAPVQSTCVPGAVFLRVYCF